ncbi:MAG: helix-turn-helix domain-containing protein [Desulfofustis sp.]|nr:helix-turn-helix domain-containing protein [Desulfofustis sp.]
MPAKAPKTTAKVAARLVQLGQKIRGQRKALRVSATAAAQAAGISRVTLYRIENGMPSVTIGAYVSTADALGIDVDLVLPEKSVAGSPVQIRSKGLIPVRIRLEDYPQLKRLAWQVHGTDVVSPKEALGIYNRNWRHLDEEEIDTRERDLIEALRLAFADDPADV